MIYITTFPGLLFLYFNIISQLSKCSCLILIWVVIEIYLGLGTLERKHVDLPHYSLEQKVQITQFCVMKVSLNVIQHHK